MLRKWLEDRRNLARADRRRRGFDFAAGVLLRAADVQSAEAELDSYTDGALTFGSHDEFDLGISDAVHAYRRKLTC